MATYLGHKWRQLHSAYRPTVFTPTLVRPVVPTATPAPPTEVELLDAICQRYGIHVKVTLQHTHSQFQLHIEPAPKTVLKLEKIKPIHTFLTRWGQETYLLRLLELPLPLPDILPLPIVAAVRDPSNA
jgi:hypothetical protein